MYAVDPVLCASGNSYVDACTEQWLVHAASLGAYPREGPFVGDLEKVRAAFEVWLESTHGDLPEWPASPHGLKRMGQNERRYKVCGICGHRDALDVLKCDECGHDFHSRDGKDQP